MSEQGTLCWKVGGNYLTEGLYLDLTEDEIAARVKQVRYETTKLENSKWLVIQRKSLEDTRENLDKKQFENSQTKRKSFNMFLEKYFIGDEYEIEILRALRLDNFLLLASTFNQTLFKMIFEKGLQGNFAEAINGFFKEHWAIPQWLVHRAKKSTDKFKSMDNFKSEADKLQESKLCVYPPQTYYVLTYSELDSYLPQNPKQSLPATSSLGTHSTAVGLERRVESLLPPSTSGGRFLHPIPPNYGIPLPNPTSTSTSTTNTEASLTPPNLPQIAEYGDGQQNYHMPQGHQASYSTNNYVQSETHHPSKRQRVEGPQNTPFSESYIPAWGQIGTPLSTSGHGPHFTAHQPVIPGISNREVPGNGLRQHNIPRH